jgi:mannose-6-phosphate isomerase-like protein (cupin superfamily)
MTDAAAVHQTSAPMYDFAGSRMKLHLTGRQTGGAFCLLESLMPPGYGTPAHLHEEEDESFLVLEGQLDVTIGGRTVTVRAGESVFAPRGVAHQLRNNGSRPVRAIVVAIPPGFDEFVAAAGVPATDGPAPAASPERLASVASRFGIRIAP